MAANTPVLADFVGEWRLAREIDDRRAGAVARFEGQATFRPAEEGLLYAETGTLFLPGAPPMTASRRYRWHPSGAAIEVLFEDGRPFHRFDPAAAPEAAHWCDPDAYRVRYDFADWPVWTSRWSVIGPRKDYTSENRYCRACACP